MRYYAQAPPKKKKKKKKKKKNTHTHTPSNEVGGHRSWGGGHSTRLRPALRVYQAQTPTTRLEVISSGLGVIAPGLRPALLVHKTHNQNSKHKHTKVAKCTNPTYMNHHESKPEQEQQVSCLAGTFTRVPEEVFVGHRSSGTPMAPC